MLFLWQAESAVVPSKVLSHARGQSLTLPTCHALRGWLNLLALWNMCVPTSVAKAVVNGAVLHTHIWLS